MALQRAYSILRLELENVTKPYSFDVSRQYDRRTDGIQYLGIARRQTNGLYKCLANVAGALCVVEVRINFDDLLEPAIVDDDPGDEDRSDE